LRHFDLFHTEQKLPIALDLKLTDGILYI